MRALLVEDDATIAEFVARGLREAGFAVDRASNGDNGLDLAIGEPYDVAIVDLMLPKRDGLSLIEELRKQKIATPVLILSARRSVDDRVRGLQAGGDDYLTKPFAMVELSARVEAMLRRLDDVRTTMLHVGDLEMDLIERTVHRGNNRIDLLPREFRLLEYFLRRPGRVITRAMLLKDVWQYHFSLETNVVDVHISNLRKKIDTKGAPSLIVNIRGAGYMLNANP